MRPTSFLATFALALCGALLPIRPAAALAPQVAVNEYRPAMLSPASLSRPGARARWDERATQGRVQGGPYLSPRLAGFRAASQVRTLATSSAVNTRMARPPTRFGAS